jgi:SAM-dependent methyltransferase
MEFERIADKKRLNFIKHALLENAPPYSAVLDVGCGNGIITIEVGKMGYQVTGIDSSERSISNARAANSLSNVEFSVVAAGEFTPPPSNYSAIICSEVIEHLHQPGDLLQQLRSALKDDGILIVTVPNGYGPRELLVTKPVQYLQKKNNMVWRLINALKRKLGYSGITVQSSADDLTHIQFYTYSSLSKLAIENGFRIVKVAKGNFMEQVFPFSLIARRSITLQKLDCKLADVLPKAFSSGFMTVWKKKN